MLAKIKPLILIICLAGVSTALFTWPFITKLQSYYLDAGDYPLNGWILWYNFVAMTTGRIFNQTLYFQTFQFYPLPYSLAYSDHLFLPSLIFSPLYFLSHNLILSVNAYVFIAFILNFISMYYVAYCITKNFFASIIAAIIYTFNPLTYAHINYGHINLMGRYFLPPLLLFAHSYLQRPSYVHSFLFWLTFTLNALTSIPFLLLSSAVLILLLPVYFIIKISILSKHYIFQIAKTSLVLIIFLPILLYFNMPYLTFSNKEGAIRSLNESFFSVAYPLDWILSTPDSLLYGKRVKEIEPMRYPKETNGQNYSFSYSEHTLFLNIVPMILVAWGIAEILKKFKSQTISQAKKHFLIISMTIMFITFIATTAQAFSLIYFILPFLHGIRTPTRFEFIFYVPFALVAAIGFSRFNKKKKVYVIVSIVAIVLLFLENYHLNNYTQTSNQLNDLESKINQFSFLDSTTTFHIPYPVSNMEASHYLNWDTITREKMFNGYSGYFPKDWAHLILEVNKNLDEHSIIKLAALDINYIIIHKDLLSQLEWTRLKKNILYDQTKKYENERILILNTKNYQAKINFCNKHKDLSIKKIKGKLFITNLHNCYLPSKFEQRYTTFIIEEGSNKRKIELKLPLLISPFEKIEL